MEDSFIATQSISLLLLFQIRPITGERIDEGWFYRDTGYIFPGSFARGGGHKREEKEKGRRASLERSRTRIPRMQTHRVHPADLLLVDHAIETRISLTLRRLGRGGLAAFHVLVEHSRPSCKYCNFFLLLLLSFVTRLFDKASEEKVELG